MKRAWFFAALAIACAFFASPAAAQFPVNQYAGASTGTNTVAITIPNWSRNFAGVPLFFLPANDNTGATTLNVSGVGALALQKLANAGVTALTGGELRAGQIAQVEYDGTRFILMNPQGQTVQAANIANSALAYGMPVNLQINATVSTNALTIALKTNDGNNATASNPIKVPFRNPTIATGSPQFVDIVAAQSFTIASGNTMGCVSGQMCRLWIVESCSTGPQCDGSGSTNVTSLCAFNALSGFNVAPINEAALQTSASGTSGGNLAQTYYCNISAVTARAIRILGYIEIQEATAGTWATGPTTVQLFGPGIKRPGDPVQNVSTVSSSLSTGNGTSLATMLPSATITPTSAANIIRTLSSGPVTQPSNGTGFAQIYRNAGASAACTTPVGSASSVGAGSGNVLPLSLAGTDTPATATQQTYVLCIKNNVANNFLYCSPAVYTMTCTLDLQEIMSALPEPANDNGLAPRMVG